MNDSGPTSAVESLLESARRDGPSAAARTKIWVGVANAAGAAAAAGGAAAGATKMLATGTLLGGAVTVGLAAALIYVGTAKPAAPLHMGVAVAATSERRIAPSPLPSIADAPSTFETVEPAAVPAPVMSAEPARLKAKSAPAVNPSAGHGGLAEEASLISKARAALVRGDAASALRTIDAARALPGRQLEPEELAVRAQVLRALGKTREANAADAALRARYPLSELVRSR